MRRRADGNVVNIASDLVEHPVVPYHVGATAKATLIGFSRHLSAQLGAVGHIRKLCRTGPVMFLASDWSRFMTGAGAVCGRWLGNAFILKSRMREGR